MPPKLTLPLPRSATANANQLLPIQLTNTVPTSSQNNPGGIGYGVSDTLYDRDESDTSSVQYSAYSAQQNTSQANIFTTQRSTHLPSYSTGFAQFGRNRGQAAYTFSTNTRPVEQAPPPYNAAIVALSPLGITQTPPARVTVTVSPVSTHNSTNTDVCRNHYMGKCTQGSDCNFQHPSLLQPPQHVLELAIKRGEGWVHDANIILNPIIFDNYYGLRAIVFPCKSHEIDQIFNHRNQLDFKMFRLIVEKASHLVTLFAINYNDTNPPIPILQRKLESRDADIKLGGINADTPPLVLANLFSLVTGIRVSAIEKFKSSRGRCSLWLDLGNIVGEQREESISRGLNKFKEWKLWMTPLTHEKIFLATDAASQQFLDEYLDEISKKIQQKAQFVHFHLHYITAERCSPKYQQSAQGRASFFGAPLEGNSSANHQAVNSLNTQDDAGLRRP